MGWAMMILIGIAGAGLLLALGIDRRIVVYWPARR